MPARATVTKRVRGGASRARGAGEASFERLTQSVEAAEAALKDLRKELSKGTREVLEDIDKTLRDARKNLRSVSRTVSKDLEEIQHTLTAGKPARGGTAGPRKTPGPASTARKTTTANATTARAAKPPVARSEETPAAPASTEKEPGFAGADQRPLP
jgi:hypothetical protein